MGFITYVQLFTKRIGVVKNAPKAKTYLGGTRTIVIRSHKRSVITAVFMNKRPAWGEVVNYGPARSLLTPIMQSSCAITSTKR